MNRELSMFGTILKLKLLSTVFRRIFVAADERNAYYTQPFVKDKNHNQFNSFLKAYYSL